MGLVYCPVHLHQVLPWMRTSTRGADATLPAISSVRQHLETVRVHSRGKSLATLDRQNYGSALSIEIGLHNALLRCGTFWVGGVEPMCMTPAIDSLAHLECYLMADIQSVSSLPAPPLPTPGRIGIRNGVGHVLRMSPAVNLEGF